MRHVGLVAGRELYETFRSRAYWLTMAVVLLGVIALVALPRLLGGESEWRLGVAGASPPGLEQHVEAAAPAFDAEVEFVRLPDRAAAEDALAEREVDAALVFGADESVTVRHATTPDPLVALAAQAAAAAELRERLAETGLDPAAVEETVAAPPPREVLVDHEQPGRTSVANAVALVLFLALVIGGGAVATGVAVEKSSRISEVLVTTVNPSHHLAGKVVGIGASTLLLLLAAAVPFMVAVLTGFLDVVPVTAAADVMAALGWFVLGYAIYATGFAVLGALVDRQEDAASATSPLTIVLFISYFMTIQVQNAPTGALAVGLSIFPLSAPVIMPVRVAEGAAGPLEIAAAIATGLLTLALLIRVGGVAYRRALLRGGRRLKLGEVLRPQGTA